MTPLEDHMARRRQGQGEALSGTPSGQFTNFAQKPIQSLREPTVADTGYEIGQLWVNTSTGIIFSLAEVAGGSADWDRISADFSGDEIKAFSESPILQSSNTVGSSPSGASGFINLMCLQQGIIMEQSMIGNQTIIAPRMSFRGLEVSLDQTVNEGVEYNFGASRPNGNHSFTIGKDPAFFFEVQFDIEDMSGAGLFVIGFRKVQNNAQALNTYSDFATIGMNGSTNPTEIVIVSRTESGPITTINTTDLWGGDNTANTLRVSVDSGGSATYTINGNTPTVIKSLKFANDLVVAPFMRFEQGADLSIASLLSMKVGFQT